MTLKFCIAAATEIDKQSSVFSHLEWPMISTTSPNLKPPCRKLSKVKLPVAILLRKRNFCPPRCSPFEGNGRILFRMRDNSFPVLNGAAGILAILYFSSENMATFSLRFFTCSGDRLASHANCSGSLSSSASAVEIGRVEQDGGSGGIFVPTSPNSRFRK